MQVDNEAARGPSLGDPAPFIGDIFLRKGQKPASSKGSWIILISHPEDLLSLFKTRTINYILCKRKTKIVMLGGGGPDDRVVDGNFLTKYITRHNIAFLDDRDCIVSSGYGLGDVGSQEGAKGVFVIDPEGILRMKLYFDLDHPRNFYEILKLVDAIQRADSQRQKRPVSNGWKRRLRIVGRHETVPEKG